MESYFASGRAIDVVLLLLAAEAILVALLLRDRRRYMTYVLALLPGLCLFLALRAALAGAAWQWIALWITASLPVHLMDLTARLKRR